MHTRLIAAATDRIMIRSPSSGHQVYWLIKWRRRCHSTNVLLLIMDHKLKGNWHKRDRPANAFYTVIIIIIIWPRACRVGRHFRAISLFVGMGLSYLRNRQQGTITSSSIRGYQAWMPPAIPICCRSIEFSDWSSGLPTLIK